MAIDTKIKLIAAIDQLIDETEANQETTGLLAHLFAGVQQVNRSFERETKFKAKKSSPIKTTGKPMPPPAEFTKEDFEKKTRIKEDAKPVDEPKAEAEPTPAPIEVDPIDPTNESELLDIVTDGLERVRENYKTPGAFKKKLKSIGVDANGKTIEELFNQAKAKFDEISQ